MSTVIASTAPAPFPPYVADTVFLVEDAQYPWPETFAIVTACNPVINGAPSVLSVAENEAGTRQLRERLRELELPHVSATGASPDLQHQEPGEAIFTDDLALAASLAAEFGQWGFFWIQQGEIYICIDGGGEGWAIGHWSDRLR